MKPERLFSFGMLKVCLVLSIAWHLLGALAIGTVPEPVAPVTPGVAVPTMDLAGTVEMLPVGLEPDGRQILRPLTSFRDPEYFGFPRTWGLGKYQSPPSAKGHVPAAAREIAVTWPWEAQTELQTEISSGMSEDWEELELTADPVAIAPSMENLFGQRKIIPSDFPKLNLHGPLASRLCLIQVLPSLAKMGPDANHTLLLGAAKRPPGPEGLMLRIWVGPQGFVTSTFLQDSSGDPQQDRLILHAVRQWRFEALADTAGSQWGILSLE